MDLILNKNYQSSDITHVIDVQLARKCDFRRGTRQELASQVSNIRSDTKPHSSPEPQGGPLPHLLVGLSRSRRVQAKLKIAYCL
jgi:hypothetical protein